MLEGLERLTGQHVRVWQSRDGKLVHLTGPAVPWSPDVPQDAGIHETPDGPAWFAPARGVLGYWIEVAGGSHEKLLAGAAAAVPILSSILGHALHAEEVRAELTDRYEEIDLLYTISEILGSTIQLEEASATIVREVSSVVGARRASIMVHDEQAGVLRTIASRGFEHDEHFQVDVRDPDSVAAKVFRERRVMVHDPSPGNGLPSPTGRPYRTAAWLSVPICHASPGGSLRCIGVINLTDRVGGDRFTPSDRKLLTAIASQVGAALENARLATRDRQQQRLHRELELAHDLQLRLLPAPTVLRGEAEVAALCRPVDSVGGDFYTFSRLGKGRVGVMVGDVSSHGFGAALVMALVLSAAGIHVESAGSPEATLRGLLDSVEDELRRAEMYLTVFYGVLDRETRTLRYASAGHHHAFKMPASGAPERLDSTVPPLGLAESSAMEGRDVPWSPGQDLLCLWTDGLVEAVDASGERYGEARLLAVLGRHRAEPVQDILAKVLAEADAWAQSPADDRTLLILRI